MGKRALRHYWKRTSRISLIGLIIAWLATGLLAIYTLRQNNLIMLEKREAVFTADKDSGDINAALKELQLYVTNHMNTSLPKLGDEKAIQLKYTYERLVTAEEERVSVARSAITQEATEYCERTLPNVPLTQRVPCVQSYIESRPVTPKSIPKELYTFDFVSPRWSPDIAGWLVVLFILLSVFIVIRIIAGLAVRHSLKSEI